MENLQQRLEFLKQRQQTLTMELDEINVLIGAYENAINQHGKSE